MAPTVPVLDIRVTSEADVSAALRDAFQACGFVALQGHGLDPGGIEACYRAAQHFFALPVVSKERYHRPGKGGARGYTPMGLETAKDHDVADLKEFFHIGRELPGRATEQDYAAVGLLPNLWPSEVAELRMATTALYRALDALGVRVLRLIASGLQVPRNYFDRAVNRGNSILRLLHYPPLANPPAQAIRAAAHEDINLLTLLVGSREPGLQILTHDGQWIDAPSGQDLVICNVGDMLQRLTNHVLPSTTHRVVNPRDSENISRFAIPFFLHPNSDFLIETLPSCVAEGRGNRYPRPILADDYLQQRLTELGLR